MKSKVIVSLLLTLSLGFLLLKQFNLATAYADASCSGIPKVITYYITGMITRRNMNPISGVTVKASDRDSNCTTSQTDETGVYRLEVGRDIYIVRPLQMGNLRFIPEQYRVKVKHDIHGLNFIGVPQ